MRPGSVTSAASVPSRARFRDTRLAFSAASTSCLPRFRARPDARRSSTGSRGISASASLNAPFSRDSAAFLTACSAATSSAPASASANVAVARPTSALTSSSAAMRSV